MVQIIKFQIPRPNAITTTSKCCFYWLANGILGPETTLWDQHFFMRKHFKAMANHFAKSRGEKKLSKTLVVWPVHFIYVKFFSKVSVWRGCYTLADFYPSKWETKLILVEQGWYGARSFGPLYDHNREGVGALVPVIDLHELKNVHDEVFNFSHEAVVDHSSSSDLPAV